MKGKRYSKEFREDAVRHWIKSGKGADEVASGLGVSTWSLRRWKTQALKELDGQALADGASVKPSDMEAEIRRLRRELRETQEQREILKKAVIFFGQDSQRKPPL